jgi:hypothetical protein
VVRRRLAPNAEVLAQVYEEYLRRQQEQKKEVIDQPPQLPSPEPPR